MTSGATMGSATGTASPPNSPHPSKDKGGMDASQQRQAPKDRSSNLTHQSLVTEMRHARPATGARDAFLPHPSPALHVALQHFSGRLYSCLPFTKREFLNTLNRSSDA
eukprot:1535487-Amphidinium_carterae.1